MRTLTIAFVAMLLVTSAAAQASTARSNSNGRGCARFPNCARCGAAPSTVAGGRSRSRRRPQVCLACGPNTDPVELENGGVECPCGAGAGTFSPAAWKAYVEGEDRCTVKRGRNGRVRSRRCPPRPTGCQICTSFENCQVSASDTQKCAYVGGDITVTTGRRLFGADEELWA
jgi:hypothetical protein